MSEVTFAYKFHHLYLYWLVPKGGMEVPTLEEQLSVLIENVPDIRRVIFFVGAGVSKSAGIPLWGTATATALELAKQRGLTAGAAAYAVEKLQKSLYYDVFDILERELPEAAFNHLSVEVFGENKPPSEIHKLLVRIPSRGIITTNFDECLAATFAIERGNIPISDIRTAMASEPFFIVKPHGSILMPKSMVLTTSGWQKVEANGDFKELLALAVNEYQVVFIGYGLGDPDFEHIWNRLLSERFFRLPAIYCCAEGTVNPGRAEQLRAKNIQVLEFIDDGSFGFVPEILRRLHAHGIPKTPAVAAAALVHATQEIEKYVLMCMQFSPTHEDRLLLVSKAIGLDVFSKLGNHSISKREFLEHLCETLGQDSSVIRISGEAALDALRSSGFIRELVGDSFAADSEKLRCLAADAAALEQAEAEWVNRVLTEHAKYSDIKLEAVDQSNVVRVFDRVLLDVGRDLAELLLFNRPPKDEFKSIDASVDDIAESSDFSGKRELYRRVVKSLLFEPQGNEEDLLFKKIQAYFIATAYVLSPTSERLLAQYARNHWVYFDASIILPALALGHPYNSVYKILLRRTQALGMRLSVIKDMFDEVWGNVRTAIAIFNEYQAFPTPLQDSLTAYVTVHGVGHGNVFVEGFLGQVEFDPQLTPHAYLSAVFSTSKGFHLSKEDVKRALAQSYGVEFDELKDDEQESEVIEELVNSIESVRKAGNRFHSRRLCEDEARQFYLIHLRRKQNPELTTKIWYVTTDRFVLELQRLERGRFPLPISYTPRSWAQYLALVDFESRGSRHFGRLQPSMRFGVLSGDIGTEAIRMIVQEQKDLLQKGLVTLKELTDVAAADFNVREVIAATEKSIRRNETTPAEGRERIQQTISKATGQYVAVRADELDQLRKEAATERAERLSAEKKLAKERYVSSTLKAQQKTQKRRNKRKKRRR